MPDRLPAAAHVSEVALTVADLGRERAFYERVLGLTPADNQNSDGSIVLGAGGAPLLHLFEDRKAKAPGHRAKLYHFAVLFPTRADLARALHRLMLERWDLQGASDHLVSEALYLSDPEGNGIELYRDRPREQWTWRGDSLEMATLPLDTEALYSEAGAVAESGKSAGYSPSPAGTVLGHMHLHVVDLPPAERFYREVVGFDLTARYGPSASFLSAGGYHHHLGMNTWGMGGAAPADDGALGLRWYRIAVPDDAAVGAVAERMASAGVEHRREPGSLAFRDPSGHSVQIVAKGVALEKEMT